MACKVSELTVEGPEGLGAEASAGVNEASADVEGAEVGRA